MKDFARFFSAVLRFQWMFTVASRLPLSKNVRLVHMFFNFGKCVFWLQLGCIVLRGGCWHGFVMWAATDQRDRLPFDAQEVQ